MNSMQERHGLAPLKAGRDRLGEARQWLAHVQGWRRRAVAFVAGLVSVAAFAPVFAWPVLFITLPVLVWLIDGDGVGEANAKKGAGFVPGAIRRAFVDGWWFGFGYFFAGLFWIGEAFLVEADKFAWLLPFAITLLPAGLALFCGAAAAGARMMWSPGGARILVLAVAFGAAEWLRGHVLTGFPWNVLGYSLTYSLITMQPAAILGIYGLTLWAVVVFCAPAVMANDAPPGRQRAIAGLRGWGISGTILLILSSYGLLVIASGRAPMLDGVRLRIVQPSVPQREKWIPEKQGEFFRLHLGLSRQNAAGAKDDMAGITHVVWPEAAMPFRPLEHPEALEAIGGLLPAGSYLIAGGLRVAAAKQDGATPGAAADGDRRAYNSLMVFGPGGGLAAVYDKIHLVPFGEYLPFQPTLEAIGLQQLTRQRGGFSTGEQPRPLLTIGGLPPVIGLICYEAIFPAAVVQGAARPGVLINVTNDGWFGNTTGPRQHLHQARVRAVEEGVPLIRAANNGISAVIDAEGRLLDSLDLNIRGVIDTGLPAAREPTVYSQLGDVVFFLNAICFFVLAFWLRPASRP